jgi:hypothetical protein
MYRTMWLSQIQIDQIEVFKSLLGHEKNNLIRQWKNEGIETYSLFEYHGLLYGYMERSNVNMDIEFCNWPMQFRELLEPWPGSNSPRYCVPMMGIYHGSKPVSPSHWKRDSVKKQVIGSLAKLKPAMYASYVFYHYQKQEETPGSFSKYYVIGAHENILFSYNELPSKKDPLAPSGLLDTNQSPSNWHEVMEPHFELWQDKPIEDRLWRKMNCWFSF